MPEGTPTDIGLAKLIESAAEDFTGVKISGASKVKTVRADAELAQTSLRNLIENAVQAAGDGEKNDGQGKVTVSVSSAEGFALIEIADKGPGVPEEARERLFLPFNTTKPRGIGMGLAFAKKALARQKGKVELFPTAKGARFRISLPLV